MSPLILYTILPALTEMLFRPFKIVGGQDGKPLVEVESEGKPARYVRVFLGLFYLKLTRCP